MKKWMKSYGVRKNINGEKEIAKRCRLQSDAVWFAHQLPNIYISTSQHRNISTSQSSRYNQRDNKTDHAKILPLVWPAQDCTLVVLVTAASYYALLLLLCVHHMYVVRMCICECVWNIRGLILCPAPFCVCIIRLYIIAFVSCLAPMLCYYGVATISGLLQIIRVLCQRAI